MSEPQSEPLIRQALLYIEKSFLVTWGVLIRRNNIEMLMEYARSAKEKIKGTNSFANTISRLQKQLDSSLYYSLRNAQKMFDTSVARTLQESIEQHQAELFAPIRKFHQSLYSTLETTYAGTLNKIRGQLECSYTGALNRFHYNIQRNYKTPHFYYREIEAAIQKLVEFNGLLRGVNFDDIAISPDGTISLANEVATLDEINKTVAEILTESAEKPTFQLFLKELVNKAKFLNKPIKIIIFYILLPYLINIAATITFSYYSNFLSHTASFNRQEAIRQVKKQISITFRCAEIKRFRFVKVNILNVRKKPTIKSKKIDELYLGQVVRIIQKKRNWSLVEYSNGTTDEVCSGWVFTRYLERFRR